MITAMQFRDTYIGKATDADGANSIQCVDLFKEVCKLAGKPKFSLGGSGYASEIVRRFNVLGLGSYFINININEADYGDWFIWDYGSKDCPLSHVAMFEKWIEKPNNALFFGQNQGGANVCANETTLSTIGVIGVLRLKYWIDINLKPLDAIAQEVIRGFWGVGEERAVRLSQEGYDYNVIQARINELLGATQITPVKS